MPTQINQIDDNDRRITTLRVEGDMLGEDARLLERIGLEIRSETGNDIIVDVADLDFLDSDAAPILRRLDMLEGFSIQGMEIFLQTVINEVERHTV
jgi:anti-anti-sigma regulatory factor